MGGNVGGWLYRKAVSWRWHERSVLDRASHGSTYYGQISPRLERLVLDYDSQFDYTDLFLWATMSGKFELCKLFWPLTAKPLATAMLGSYVCRFMVGR